MSSWYLNIRSNDVIEIQIRYCSRPYFNTTVKKSFKHVCKILMVIVLWNTWILLVHVKLFNFFITLTISLGRLLGH
jgi:hypothetical protein